jgi:RNA polymerase sigma-70 factor (ECF subfamily)
MTPAASHERWAALLDAVAKDRDRAAFATLFAYLAPRVKSYLVRLGTANELAEEMAQETMLTVWRKAALYDPGRASASAWIFAIARNRRIDTLRRVRLATAEPDPATAPPPPPDADALLATAEQAQRLHAALAQLPSSQAEVVRLSFLDERPHAEIERALGIPLGTVKSRLRLAMNRLRTLMEDGS